MAVDVMLISNISVLSGDMFVGRKTTVVMVTFIFLQQYVVSRVYN